MRRRYDIKHVELSIDEYIGLKRKLAGVERANALLLVQNQTLRMSVFSGVETPEEVNLRL